MIYWQSIKLSVIKLIAENFAKKSHQINNSHETLESQCFNAKMLVVTDTLNSAPLHLVFILHCIFNNFYATCGFSVTNMQSSQ